MTVHRCPHCRLRHVGCLHLPLCLPYIPAYWGHGLPPLSTLICFRAHPFLSLSWEMNLNTSKIPLLMAITTRKRKTAPENRALAWGGCGGLSLNRALLQNIQWDQTALRAESELDNKRDCCSPAVTLNMDQTRVWAKPQKHPSCLSDTNDCCFFANYSFCFTSFLPFSRWEMLRFPMIDLPPLSYSEQILLLWALLKVI